VYNRLVTLASVFLVAFGGLFLFGIEFIPLPSKPSVPHLPLVSLALGAVVLLYRVKPSVIDSLLAVSVGLRTWSPSHGFRPDPGLQLQPLLIPAFFLVLVATVQSVLLLAGLVAFETRPPHIAQVLLLVAFALSVRELWRVCRKSFEQSLASAHDRAA